VTELLVDPAQVTDEQIPSRFAQISAIIARTSPPLAGPR
jgi:hypothetical protein